MGASHEVEDLRRQLEQSAAEILSLRGQLASEATQCKRQTAAQQTARESEPRYRTLFDGLQEGFYLAQVIFDPDGSAGDITYLDANPAFERMMGLRRDQIVGHRGKELIPGMKAGWLEVFGQVQLTGEPATYDSYSAQFQKHFEAFVFRPAKDQCAVLVRDITQRKRADEALRESETRAEALAAATFEGIAITEQGRFVDGNEQLLQMLGYSRDELIGREIGDRIPLEERDAVLGNIREEHESHIVHTYIRKDGARIIVEAHGRTVDYQNRKVRFTAIRDITAHKQAEEELRAAKISAERARAAAEAANRAKDDFLAALSHELRNPLNPVLINASMLLGDPQFDAATRENLEAIYRNAQLVAQLIDELLDVQRIDRGKMELHRQTVELGTMIHRALEVCRPDIDAQKVVVNIDAMDGPYLLDADPTRLEQAIWNVLKNAVKFSPTGASVSIRCRRADEGFVTLDIKDSGEGIEPVALGNIFNAFEQSGRSITRQFGGLGLGLTISKALVEQHGGSIHAHSQGKGTGATFTIRLPLLKVKTQSLKSQPIPHAPSPATPIHALRILLVEDHADTARGMQLALSFKGHQVLVAGNVAKALELAAEHPFDLLISDLGLPDGSGLELMRTLRARGSDLRGIAISGYGREKDVRESREAGFIAHVVKPIDIAQLQAAIANATGNANINGTERHHANTNLVGR